MDSGKNVSKFLGARNNKIYLDLSLIIREHALQFLPAKSLFKFRGVCRDWKQAISSPFLAHNQSLSFNTLSGIFIQNHNNLPSFISLDPQSCGVPYPTLNFLPVPVDILSSSNGLLCCQARTDDRAYYICNPVTMQFKKLPKPSMDHGREPPIVLIFKPSLLNFVAEYKLICAFPSNDFDDATEFEIYSSKNDSWNVSGEINFAARNLIPKSGASVNDTAYWFTSDGQILSFDLTKDRSQLIYGCFGSYTHETLGEMNGKLCSAYIHGNGLTVSVVSDIYSNTMQMGSNSRLWANKVKISLSNEVAGGTVLYVGSEFVLFMKGRYIYRVDLKTKQVEFVVEALNCDRNVFPYVNSLAAL